jgi:hypothetical protein
MGLGRDIGDTSHDHPTMQVGVGCAGEFSNPVFTILNILIVLLKQPYSSKIKLLPCGVFRLHVYVE